MNVSSRAKNIQASPIRKLFPLAKKAENDGKVVLYINIGQPDIATPPEAIDRIKNLDTEVIAYSPSTGFTSLREKISHYFNRYGVHINPDEIAITTGGSEAVLFAIAATCDPGDNIVVAEPFYANYKSFAQLLGVELNPITTTIENSFHFRSKAEIEKKINRKTKAILLCNPSNPTGTVYTREEIEWIKDIAVEKDIFIISDEVYREFIYINREFVSPLQYGEIEDRVIVTDSISKRFSSCGARIGFLIAKNQDILTSVEKFAMARLSPPTLEQYLAEVEFDLPDSYFKGILEEYRLRKNSFIEELSGANGIIVPNPEGAFYIIIKLEGVNSEDFARFLLEDFDIDGATTMVAPAGGFYQTEGLGNDEIRAAFVLNESKMRLAAKIIREGYYTYKKQYSG